MVEAIHIIPEGKKKRLSFASKLLDSIVALLGFCALLIPFQSGYISFAVGLAAGLAVLIPGMFAGKRGGLRLILLLAVICAAAVLFGSFSRGMFSFFTDIVRIINTHFGTDLLPFAADASAYDRDVFFALMCAFAGFFISTASERGHFVAVSAMLFAVYEFFALLRIQQNIFSIAVAVTAMIVYWERKSGRAFSYAGRHSVSVFLVAAVCAVSAVALSPFGGSYTVQTVRDGIKAGVHDLRYGHDTLPDGDMRKAYSMLDGDRVTLVVESNIAHEEYFAGYRAAVFQNGKWSRHGAELFAGEWDGLFRWLPENGFYSQMQCSHYLMSKTSNPESISVTVTNTGADRSCLYLPNVLSEITDGNYRASGDLSIKGKGVFGVRKYSFTHVSSYDPETMIAELSLDKRYTSDPRSEYEKARRVYAGFVNDAYTAVDDSTRALMETVFFQSEHLEEDASLYSIVSRIRAVLEVRKAYSASPPHYTGGDFCEWFLNSAESGNSAYFATAAVMALRTAGYPARYAEGYYAKSLDAEKTELTVKNSHAWAEVFLEYAGWVPVEVTPGFYNTRLISEQTVEVSKDVAGSGSNEDSPYDLTEEYVPEEQEENDEPKGFQLRTATVIIWLLILLAAAVVFIAVKRMLVLYIRKKRFGGKDREIYLFNYIFRMLELAGISCDRTKPYDCVSAVCEKYPGIRAAEYERMVEIMQKRVFGGMELSALEQRTLTMFAKKLRNVVLSGMGLFRRCVLRYWYNV